MQGIIPSRLDQLVERLKLEKHTTSRNDPRPGTILLQELDLSPEQSAPILDTPNYSLRFQSI